MCCRARRGSFALHARCKADSAALGLRDAAGVDLLTTDFSAFFAGLCSFAARRVCHQNSRVPIHKTDSAALIHSHGVGAINLLLLKLLSLLAVLLVPMVVLLLTNGVADVTDVAVALGAAPVKLLTAPVAGKMSMACSGSSMVCCARFTVSHQTREKAGNT